MAIEKYEVSHWTNITTMLIDLLAAPDIEEHDLSSLDFDSGVARRCPRRWAKDSTRLPDSRSGGLRADRDYFPDPLDPADRAKLGCIGVPVFGVDARIIDISTLEELPRASRERSWSTAHRS